MSEEEKEAIRDTKDILKELDKHKDKDFIGRLYYKNKPIENILQILLNLIENEQKGNKNWEEIYDEDQNYIGELNDKILDLEFKIKKQQKEIEELKKKNEPQPDCAETVERTEEMVNMMWVNYNYVNKDKIKELKEIDNIDLIQFKIKELLGE